MARLLSVNVGLPQDVRWRGKTVHTAVWKQAVAGKRTVRRLNLDGDGQGDLAGHGGEQRAVLVYQIESYRYWERELGRSDFIQGQFGENFTVSGLPDDEVCIGDRYRIGGAVFEVTQPRVTCYRVGIRMDEPRMAALLVAHHRPGFYLRVLQEGEVEAGDEIVKLADGPERLSVVEADALLYLPGRDLARLERALRIGAFSPGWQAAFRDLAAQMHGAEWARNASTALNPGSAAAWPGFRPLRVTDIRAESRDVFSLALEADAGAPVAPFAPGQFITLRLPGEGERAPLLRSYSLSRAFDGARYRISIKQEPHGAAGRYLRERVRAGDSLDAAAPRGAFILRPGSCPVALLSAGIGATPVLAMLHALAGQSSTRPVWWLYGTRNSEAHPFAREVDALLHSLPGARRLIAYSRPLPADRPGTDFDLAGRLDAGALRRFGVPREADFYLCGPDAFMRDLSVGLAGWGVARERIFRELFGPSAAITPGVIGAAARPPHAPPGPPGSGPRVSFARSGFAVTWDERYASLLELAEACEVSVRFACRTGVCHTCISGLLAGSVAYDPEPLDRPAEGNVLVCCSRPAGEVAVDL